MSTSFTVRTNVEEKEESTIYWDLEFLFVTEDESEYKFTVCEHYCTSRAQWNSFMDSVVCGHENFLSFYMGNGSGTITFSNGMLEFEAQPSGGGGDVISRFKCKVPCDFVDKLRFTLQEIDEKGGFITKNK